MNSGNRDMSEALLQVENLSFSCNRGLNTVVDEASFSVFGGEIVALVGLSEARLSIFLELVIGITKADSGKVVLNGFVLEDDALRFKNSLGFVWKELAVGKHLRIKEFLLFMGNMYGLFGREVSDRVEALSKSFGLSDRLEESIGSCSKDLQQRVAIASAIIHEPCFLIMDDPFSNLEPDSVTLLRDYLSDYAADGKAVLFSATDSSAAQLNSNRVLLLHQGRIQQVEPKEHAAYSWPEEERLTHLLEGLGVQTQHV